MKPISVNRGEVTLYRTDDGKTALEGRLEDETVRLMQEKQYAKSAHS